MSEVTNIQKKTKDYIERALASGYTQAQIARAVGVDYVTVFRWRTMQSAPYAKNYVQLQELVEGKDAAGKA